MYMAGYGKRPLWQWVLIYLVVGGVIYGVVYYVIAARNGSTMYGGQGNPSYSATGTGGY